MLDPITLTIVTGAAGNLAAAGVAYSAGKIKERFDRDAALERALNSCCQAGLTALILSAEDQVPQFADVVELWFREALEDEELLDGFGSRLRRVLRGKSLEVDDMADLFQDHGFDLSKVPGLDLEVSFREFEAVFLERAVQEDILRKEAEAYQRRRQTQLLERVVELLEAGREHHDQPRATQLGETARQWYLQNLATHCLALPLTELGGKGQGLKKVQLDDVFIQLNTKTRVPRTTEEKEEVEKEHGYLSEDRILSAGEAADRHAHLVLLGDPGSGKSSFVRHLLARLAMPGPEAANTGQGQGLVPIFLVLRHLAPLLAKVESSKLDSEQRRLQLVEALRAAVVDSARLCGAAEFGDGLFEALKKGRCFLVLDGLDEVPASLRSVVGQAVEAALQTLSLARVIVTCRVRSYQDSSILPDFAVHELAPLSSDQIARFAEAWYLVRQHHGYLTPDEAQGRIADLQSAAQRLPQMAENPMLLTTMALVHQQNIQLPPQKVCLYHEAVKVLMFRWQASKGLTGKLDEELVAILKDDSRLRPILERLAFEIHCTEQRVDEEMAAGLEWGRIVHLLRAPEYLGSTRLAEAFLEYVDEQAGVLVGRGAAPDQPLVYSFPHRTFQEYLAGCYLISQTDPGSAIYARAAAGDFWFLPVQLAAEELLHNRRVPQFLLGIAVGLFPVGGKRSEQARRASLWASWMAVLLESQSGALKSSGPESWKSFLGRCRKRLCALLGKGLSVRERAEAGRLLGRLGDPRPEVTTIEAMEFCYVPAGPFWMGSDDSDELAFDDEKPITRQEVDYEYWMARYPVTQAQFRAFVDAGGYREARFWPEAKAAERWTAETGFDQRQGPDSHGERFDLSNHPVVGVSWFEALAFTRWLTAEYRERGWLPAGWCISLPSELEWEKAARGGEQVLVSALGGSMEMVQGWICKALQAEQQENPEPRRFVPWSGGFEADRLNWSGQRLGATSPPGLFPKGCSPVGCEEMCGNVWEWTRSHWKDYPYPAEQEERGEREDISKFSESRVVRGGSWDVNHRYARCAVRNGDRPDFQLNNLGFRVVLLPSTLNSVSSEL